MNGFNKTNIHLTHYTSVTGELIPIPQTTQEDTPMNPIAQFITNTINKEESIPMYSVTEINPFPIKEEVKPMKLTLTTEKGEIMEYNLWFAHLDPTEMDSMTLVKAVFDYHTYANEIQLIESKWMLRNLHNNHNYDDSVKSNNLTIIDDNFLDAKLAIEAFGAKLDALEVFGAGEEYFHPGYAYSIRDVQVKTKNVTRKATKIGESDQLIEVLGKTSRVDEMLVSEKMNGKNYGWVIEFNSYVFTDLGQHYKKKWPVVMHINYTPNGARLMWINNKTKTPIWGQSYGQMVQKKLVPSNMAIGSAFNVFRDEILKPEDVLKVLKYIPFGRIGDTTSWLHPHEITQSDIYWIGGETSTKKILNKAFKHPHGVTKNIFGGINNIKEFEDLRAAIALLQAARGFSPQVLEKLMIKEVRSFFSWRPADMKDGLVYFFKHFGFKEEYILSMFGEPAKQYQSSMAHEAIDVVNTFKQIKGRNHRTAIKQHVARTKMNITEIHNFVNAEFDKIKTANKKFVKNDFWKKYAAFNGKEIAEGIQMIVPETTHELVEWGATQNNCIGSYANRVYDNNTMILGFKNAEGNWIGHAEISSDMRLRQLLGKHNIPVEETQRKDIVAFLEKEFNVEVENYWGA